MNTIAIEDVFERRLTYPDTQASKRLSRLVGIDLEKERLSKILNILINPASVQSWLNKYHNDAHVLGDIVLRRPPLIILSGDVGTGKTELAETIGDAVARRENIDITLFPLSLSSRGSGRVGEMTKLISTAFDFITEQAIHLKRQNGGKSSGALILLIDEADALTQSREASQMHHEDRAGVNALIRGVDRLAEQHFPVAIIMCTNRISAIDPAVLRRAADIFEFGRPNEQQRYAVLETPLGEAGFNPDQISNIVSMTGSSHDRDYGFTYSDLTQRLLPTMVLNAYPKHPITFENTIQLLKKLKPTPPFKQEGL